MKSQSVDLFLRASIGCGCCCQQMLTIESIAQEDVNLYCSKKLFSISSLGAWKCWAEKEWMLQVFIVVTYPVGENYTEHKQQGCQMVLKLKQRPRKAAIHAKISAVKKKNIQVYFSFLMWLVLLPAPDKHYLPKLQHTRTCWDPANLITAPKWNGLLLELGIIYRDIHVCIS